MAESIVTKLDRRFINTNVDPQNKTEWTKFLMDLNLYLDDISRAINSPTPMAGAGIYTNFLLEFHAAQISNVHGVGASTVESTDGAQAKANAAQAAAISSAVATSEAYADSLIQVAGSATLSGGVATVSCATITATSLVFLTVNGPGVLANMGTIYEDPADRTAGASFKIRSTNASSSATVAWTIREP